MKQGEKTVSLRKSSCADGVLKKTTSSLGEFTNLEGEFSQYLRSILWKSSHGNDTPGRSPTLSWGKSVREERWPGAYLLPTWEELYVTCTTASSFHCEGVSVLQSHRWVNLSSYSVPCHSERHVFSWGAQYRFIDSMSSLRGTGVSNMGDRAERSLLLIASSALGRQRPFVFPFGQWVQLALIASNAELWTRGRS